MQFPIAPMKAMPGTPAFLNRPGYLYEIKWDGIRCIAVVTDDHITLWSGGKRIINSEFPEILEALEDSVPNELRPLVLDGELVWLTEGYPDRQRLQNRLSARPASREAGLRYVMFDVLLYSGMDLTGERFDFRHNHLYRVGQHPNLLVSVTASDSSTLWQMVNERNLEGLMAKPAASRYHVGRRIAWVKIKHNQRDVYEIVGYTSGEGSRHGLFGALVLAKQVDGQLLYGGKVGTGFTLQSARNLLNLMQPRIRQAPALEPKDVPRALKHITSKRPVTWIEPGLQATVEFNDTTDDGIPLFPSFKGLT